MSKLDDDVSGADLDKTPSTEKKDNSRRSRKSDTKKQNEGDKSPAGWFQGQKCYGGLKIEVLKIEGKKITTL